MAAGPQTDKQPFAVIGAGPVHAEVIAALRAEGFEDAWSGDSIRSLMATPGTFALLVVAGEEPAGFILCRVIADEAEVLAVAVRPAWRRHGLGGRLLDAALARARQAGVRQMFLEVGVDNGAALGLYRSRGFVEVGRRCAYYPHPGRAAADALILGRAFG